MAPLIIDFDKTLIKDDSLFKSYLRLELKKKLLLLFFIIKNGKVDLKKYLWKNNLMTLNVEFNSNLLDLAVTRKAYIVSGSIDQYLKQLLYDFVPTNRIFGTKKLNLIGSNKKNFLVKKFGYKKFDYIGDSFSDICVWKAARKAYAVKRVWLYKFFVPSLKHVDEIK